MAKAKETEKDRPLLLRKRQDGSLELLKGAVWPPRHEFSLEWLLEHTGDGTVLMNSEGIHITLANGSAVYKVTQRPGEVDEDGNRTTGYWGERAEGTVD